MPTKQENIQFLEENAKRDAVTVTGSGLQYEVVQQGDGASPSASDTVEVHYVGTFIDGETFDSSRDRGSTAEFLFRVQANPRHFQLLHQLSA